ncbi:AGC family serine/threonine-protein kinase [Sporobolomyces salmoneus]|uniref:AGC family serine/threonine-protein kinase n=1 Tax=Sporobolomyces salmoneus TaxID=183962 RepID=UPI0031725D2B
MTDFVSDSSTPSWLGTLAQPPAPSSPLHSKFSTIALGHTQATRRPRGGLGIFEDGQDASRPSPSEEEDSSSSRRREDHLGAWSITLAEGPKSRSRNKKPNPALTVYVSTPTSSLTLTRKLSEILDFETSLRAQFPDLVSLRSPPPPTTIASRRRSVLASLSRTLSPRRSSQSSSSSHSSHSRTTVDLKELSTILTKVSLDTSIRSHQLWRQFFVIRKDDLESARVERRIKRARSDQTMHVGGAAHLAHSFSQSQGVAVELKKGSLDRLERQEVSTMSGSTNEVMMNTPNLIERASYFSSSNDGTEQLAIDTESPSVQPLEQESIQVSPSVREEEEEQLEPVVDHVEPASIDQVMSSSPTPADTELDESCDSTTQPTSTSFLSPHSSLPSSPQASKMTRSLSSSSAMSIEKRSKGVTIDSFEIKRVLGKGCAGKVLLVKLKGTEEHFALKAITKRHVLAHRELVHTRTEQSVLKTCARDKSNPFIVKLHYSFHDHDTLYLALEFHSGGDLATQLARWGRLGRDRARFYMAEMVEGVEGLHRAGIIYRDLKPENVLISADGHIILTDFGLSKDFGHSRVTPPTATLKDELPRPHWLSGHPTQRAASTPPATISSFGKRETAMTFCGTAEYLAPEVLLGEPYSYEVDAWSAGTMLYEMLVGITPFFAEDHSTMYKRVLSEELEFEEDPEYPVFDDDTRSFIRGMLQKNPLIRMTDARIKAHPYFNMIDWSHVYHKRYVPPFVPRLSAHDPTDTSQFDDMFLSMPAKVEAEDGEEGFDDRDAPVGEPQAAFDEGGRDVFDGYSYYGRDSDSIRRFESMEVANIDAGDEEDQPLAASQVDKDETSPITQMKSSAPPSVGTMEEIEPLESQASSSDVSGINDSGMLDSDNTLSSLATVSTLPTTVAADSPAPIRRRQSSSRSSNLEPVAELPVVPISTEIVLEESEDVSDGDWDLLDANDFGGFSRNGGREATLFAKGIRDKYRLVVAPLSSPLRSPSGLRAGSRIGSRKGSSSSGRSSLVGTSLSTTPEPPRSPSGLLRFAPGRNKGSKRASHSKEPSPLLDSIQTSASLATLSSPSSPRPPSSNGSSSNKLSSSFSASSLANTSSSIKNFARSTFLSPQKPHDKTHA